MAAVVAVADVGSALPEPACCPAVVGSALAAFLAFSAAVAAAAGFAPPPAMACKIADAALVAPPALAAVAVWVPLLTGRWGAVREAESGRLVAAADGAVLDADGEPEAEGAGSGLPSLAVGPAADAGVCAIGCWPVCGGLAVELGCGAVGAGLGGIDVLASSKSAKDCALDELAESWLGVDVCIGDGGASETAGAKSDAIPGIPDTRELLKATRTAHRLATAGPLGVSVKHVFFQLLTLGAEKPIRQPFRGRSANFAAWRPAMAVCGSAAYSIVRPKRMTIEPGLDRSGSAWR